VRKGLTVALLFAAVAAYGPGTQATPSQTCFGWDLAYRALLDCEQPPKSEFLAVWLDRTTQPPICEAVRFRPDEPVTAAILIELPAFHAGERLTSLYIRTAQGACSWRWVEEKPAPTQPQAIPASTFDTVYANVSNWKQSEPLRSGEYLGDEVPVGYIGFLSVYGPGVSGQWMFSLADVFEGGPSIEKIRKGRLFRALGPLSDRI
jgi:hypothetical protein